MQGHKDEKGTATSFIQGEAERALTVKPETQGSGRSYQCVQTLDENEEEGVGFFSKMPTNRTGGNGHELNIGKFSLETRKHFFPVRLVKHQNKLPEEVVESSSVEMFKRQLVLGDSAWAWMLD